MYSHKTACSTHHAYGFSISKAQVLEALRNHTKRTDAAKALGISYQHFYRCLQRYGVKLRRPSKLTDEDVKLIRQLLAGGLSEREVADKFDVCQSTINDIAIYKTFRWVR